ncbi:hypothetical protein BAUCODRAFT_238816 [Baudoinia panamericana UAMH 10762]|uniref:Transmembrane protein n=1 Tax=Baudoinia panamericana (strain UAMH 10762) TaxID=717646 RepID=M2LGY4_BAUPA|nr:uncharacterized protein BAUCODRAFT_238816 [Baudoinia panamericana UAMH 10762]EMC93377.1 hypothetical protein BAUCODRAFT_238816 [Baudoinia panamericana UAMH 10762]
MLILISHDMANVVDRIADCIALLGRFLLEHAVLVVALWLCLASLCTMLAAIAWIQLFNRVLDITATLVRQYYLDLPFAPENVSNAAKVSGIVQAQMREETVAPEVELLPAGKKLSDLPPPSCFTFSDNTLFGTCARCPSTVTDVVQRFQDAQHILDTNVVAKRPQNDSSSGRHFGNGRPPENGAASRPPLPLSNANTWTFTPEQLAEAASFAEYTSQPRNVRRIDRNPFPDFAAVPVPAVPIEAATKRTGATQHGGAVGSHARKKDGHQHTVAAQTSGFSNLIQPVKPVEKRSTVGLSKLYSSSDPAPHLRKQMVAKEIKSSIPKATTMTDAMNGASQNKFTVLASPARSDDTKTAGTQGCTEPVQSDSTTVASDAIMSGTNGGQVNVTDITDNAVHASEPPADLSGSVTIEKDAPFTVIAEKVAEYAVETVESARSEGPPPSPRPVRITISVDELLAMRKALRSPDTGENPSSDSGCAPRMMGQRPGSYVACVQTHDAAVIEPAVPAHPQKASSPDSLCATEASSLPASAAPSAFGSPFASATTSQRCKTLLDHTEMLVDDLLRLDTDPVWTAPRPANDHAMAPIKADAHSMERPETSSRDKNNMDETKQGRSNRVLAKLQAAEFDLEERDPACDQRTPKDEKGAVAPHLIIDEPMDAGLYGQECKADEHELVRERERETESTSTLQSQVEVGVGETAPPQASSTTSLSTYPTNKPEPEFFQILSSAATDGDPIGDPKQLDLRRKAQVALERFEDCFKALTTPHGEGRQDPNTVHKARMAQLERARFFYQKRREALKTEYAEDEFLQWALPEVRELPSVPEKWLEKKGRK